MHNYVKIRKEEGRHIVFSILLHQFSNVKVQLRYKNHQKTIHYKFMQTSSTPSEHCRTTHSTIRLATSRRRTKKFRTRTGHPHSGHLEILPIAAQRMYIYRKKTICTYQNSDNSTQSILGTL